MNYIRHLNKFFTVIQNDDNFTSSHLSLYMALFQYWNFNRFKNPFPIYRVNIMQLSKLAKNTYHKCLRELDNKYLYYHSPVSKFDYARITLFPLGQQEAEASSKFQQLIFNFDVTQPGTDRVANLTPTCRNIETDSVANLRHYIKQNILKQHCVINNTHPQVFLNEDISSSNSGNVIASEDSSNRPIPGSTAPSITINKTLMDPPSLLLVQLFFQENNYPPSEAEKFFHYNQSKNWMLTEKFRIQDWQSLAHKWMLNCYGNPKTDAIANVPLSSWRGVRGEFSPFSKGGGQPSWLRDLQHFFSLYLSGQNISKLLRPEHFDELQLTLKDDILTLAKQRRINQLSGSNERSELDLLHSYINNENQHLLTKDHSNLISLAKRLAILNHFETLKSEGKTSLQL